MHFLEWDDTIDELGAAAKKKKKKGASAKASVSVKLPGKPAVKVKASALKTAAPKPASKPKPKKKKLGSKLKSKLKKVGKGVLAVSTGGASLMTKKGAPKGKVGQKIRKAALAIGTGGVSLATKKGAPKGKLGQKIRKGVLAVATGGISLATKKGAPKGKIGQKIRKGVKALATGGISLAVDARKKKKAKTSRPVVSSVAKMAETARLLAPVAASQAQSETLPSEPALPADAIASAPVVDVVDAVMPGKAAELLNKVNTLAERVDKAADQAMAKAKPRDRRSRFKLQIFSKLKDLTKSLPVSDPCRVKANQKIILECREVSRG